jgi:uncharacterized membrane protein YvbJ
MVLCTSCGNQVEESASFCTSCGKPMPAGTAPSAAVTVTRPVCSSCAQADLDSVFCTECGKRLSGQPAAVAEAVPAVASTPPLSAKAGSATTLPTAFCTNCGSMLGARTGFCTNCGRPVSATSNASSISSEPEWLRQRLQQQTPRRRRLSSL